MSMGKQIYYHHIRENLKKMNPLLKDLAVQAGAVRDNDTVITSSMDDSIFARLIIEHILLKLENEIALAYEQEQDWTAATLEALALEILDDFDMELDSGD